ncbi:hypothetical protein D3C78_237690 [compost metagenome]
MDNQLIDATLQQLLATPHELRTPDYVVASLSLAAEAADATLNAATPLENELHALRGALEAMAVTHGMQPVSCLQNYPGTRSDLYGSLRLDEQHFGAFGKTAAEVVAGIRRKLDDQAVPA